MHAFQLHAKLQRELKRPIQLRLIMQMKSSGLSDKKITKLITKTAEAMPTGKIDRIIRPRSG